MSSDSEQEYEDYKDPSIESPDVVTKYKTAAQIANAALARAASLCVPGASIVSICSEADKLIVTETDKVYNKPVAVDGGDGSQKTKIEKGVAFPTCVSPNHCACHLSPLSNEDKQLQAGDIVTIQLGVHIDGFMAIAANTVQVPPGEGNSAPSASVSAVPADQNKASPADVWNAAYYISEAALRLLRPGNTNDQVTEVIANIAEEYHVKPLEGTLSHEMKRFVIDGNKVIIGKSSIDHKVDTFTFAENEVYCIDIAVSTGEGKPKDIGTRTTVFKRQIDQEYQLKLKASRQLFTEINQKYTAFPFGLRSLQDERRAKLGITEIVNHGLVAPYPVLYEKEGETVARIQFTALIMPSQTLRITDVIKPTLNSNIEIQNDEIKTLLAQSVKKSKKKNKNKKKASADASAEAPEEADGAD